MKASVAASGNDETFDISKTPNLRGSPSPVLSFQTYLKGLFSKAHVSATTNDVLPLGVANEFVEAA